MKKQTGIAKDQYKFFRDQINAINNNREDVVKAEYGIKTKDGADEIEMLRNVKATSLEESIGEKVKLRRRKVETLKGLRIEKIIR